MAINLIDYKKKMYSKCVFAFPNAYVSLVAVCDWDTVKEKKYFFSVQVLFIISIEQLVVKPILYRDVWLSNRTSA